MTTLTHRFIRNIAGIATLFTVTSASAQSRPVDDQSRRVGDFEIYFSAMPLDQLPEQISKRYNLQRGPNAAMLQVTVRRNANGSDTAAAIPRCGGRVVSIQQAASVKAVTVCPDGKLPCLSTSPMM